MIPLCVKVKGFLSYQEEQEINFAGATLWMLTGPNGAGKSTMLDAITYVLYGKYRGGDQHDEELVNQNSKGFEVKFDFRLGDQVYRAERTLSLRRSSTKKTLQILSLSGTKPIIEPDTTSEKGFDQWVTTHIRLDYKAFVASVLLQQGNSDALVSAKAADRHKILGQLIDIEAYVKLAKRADEKHKNLKLRTEFIDEELSRLPKLTDVDKELEQLSKNIDSLRLKATAAQSDLQHLARLKTQAEQWEGVQGELDKVNEAIGRAEQLLSEEVAIEQDAKRFELLQTVLPQLDSLHSNHKRLAEVNGSLRKIEADGRTLADKLVLVTNRLGESRRKSETLEREKADLASQQTEIQIAQNVIAPDLVQLAQLDEIRGQLEKVDVNLNSFVADLDTQLATSKGEVARLDKLTKALPWLEQFTSARGTWRTNAIDADTAQTEIGLCDQQIVDLQARQDSLQSEVVKAETNLEVCKEKTSGRRWKANLLHERLENLHEIEGKAECPHCGQELKPGHIDKERQSLSDQLNDAEVALGEADREQTLAATHKTGIETQIGQLGEELKHFLARRRLAEGNLRTAQQAQSHALDNARAAITNLPPLFARKISVVPAETDTVFKGEYPTATELVALRAEGLQYDICQRALSELETQTNERKEHQIERRLLVEKLSPLEEKYSPDRVAQINSDHKILTERYKQVYGEIKRVEEQLPDSWSALTAIQGEGSEIEAQQAEIKGNLQWLSGQRDTLSQLIDGQVAEIAVEWQPVAMSLEADQLTSLHQEHTRLQDAPIHLRKVESAKSDIRNWRAQVIALEAKLDSIPAEARQPHDFLEHQELDAQHDFKETNVKIIDDETEKRGLDDKRHRRVNYEQEYANCARRSWLYKELAILLGRDRLQQVLLAQTLQEIVEYANAMLNRISGGMLHLELKSLASEIIAHNRQAGSKPIPIRCLSGGQRFRVAISLALGIGQYATREAQAVESVIIDEGFGSLDERGRQEMSDELLALQNELKCIIIVSHQPDFAEAFPNRYSVEFRDGTSRVDLM